MLLPQARPLTRYLPIRKEDFDLKLHIESSGHSVDTCCHVILSEKMCKGYLVKMGGKIKSWKKRWFVFDRMKRTVSYYVGKSPIHRPHLSLPVPALWACGSPSPGAGSCVGMRRPGGALPLLRPVKPSADRAPPFSPVQTNTRRSSRE